MKKLANAPVNRCRGFSVKLLVKNRFQQRFERRGRGVKAKFEVAYLVDQGPEFGIIRTEVLKSLSRIEREAPAFPVMDHP